MKLEFRDCFHLSWNGYDFIVFIYWKSSYRLHFAKSLWGWVAKINIYPDIIFDVEDIE